MKPQANEYAPYFERYISLVSEDDVVGAIERQMQETATLLASVGEEKSTFRYAPEKWSIKQVVGHVTDAERVFAYRLMCKHALGVGHMADHLLDAPLLRRVAERRLLLAHRCEQRRGLLHLPLDRAHDVVLGNEADVALEVRRVFVRLWLHERGSLS